LLVAIDEQDVTHGRSPFLSPLVERGALQSTPDHRAPARGEGGGRLPSWLGPPAARAIVTFTSGASIRGVRGRGRRRRRRGPAPAGIPTRRWRRRRRAEAWWRG